MRLGASFARGRSRVQFLLSPVKGSPVSGVRRGLSLRPWRTTASQRRQDLELDGTEERLSGFVLDGGEGGLISVLFLGFPLYRELMYELLGATPGMSRWWPPKHAN